LIITTKQAQCLELWGLAEGEVPLEGGGAQPVEMTEGQVSQEVEGAREEETGETSAL